MWLKQRRELDIPKVAIILKAESVITDNWDTDRYKITMRDRSLQAAQSIGECCEKSARTHFNTNLFWGPCLGTMDLLFNVY